MNRKLFPLLRSFSCNAKEDFCITLFKTGTVFAIVGEIKYKR